MQALQSTPSICGESRQVARCAGSTQGQANGCSFGQFADGFLSHSFLPLYQAGQQIPLRKDIELGYYSSLSILGKLHHMEMEKFADKPYPYNVLLSFWDAKKKLNRQPIYTTLHIVRDDHERVRIGTKQQFETGHTLFYIPVMPLFRLFRMREQKVCAELMLSVYAYLYHIVQIPYYREVSSYMFYHYECTKEWLAECA